MDEKFYIIGVIILVIVIVIMIYLKYFAKKKKILKTGPTGLVPLYRLHNSTYSNHMLSTSPTEGVPTFVLDGILGYMFGYQATGTVPLYRVGACQGWSILSFT